jgi:hypothetical protein
MSSGRRQKRSKQLNPDVSEEGKQQELELPDQPSSSWSDVGGAEEKSEAGPPRVSLAGATDNEQETEQQEGWDFDSSENESSHSSASSSQPHVPRVSTHPNPTMSSGAPHTVKVGGEDLTLVTQANVVSATPTTTYTKQSRVGLSDEKRIELMSKATKKILPTASLLDLVTISFTTPDALKDTIQVSENIDLLYDQMILYDFVDVMTVVKYDESDPATVVTKDLFKDYMTITPEEVARSNEWYRKYVDTMSHPWISENLQMGVVFLRNNMTETLWHEVHTEHKKYPVSQQGGPLAYILMMKAIQQNNDICLKNLTNRVETLKITEFDGEDVGLAVTLVLGGIERLRAATKFQTTGGETFYRYIPDDFYHKLLKMLQTTSVEKFNEVFKAQELEYLKERNMPGALPSLGADDKAIDDLLKQAKNLYNTLCGLSEWTGVNAKGSHSTFSAEGGKGRGPCWVCGKIGHYSRDCTLPEDQRDSNAYEKRREESRRLRWGNRGRKGGRGGSGGSGQGRGHGDGSSQSPQVPKSGKWAKPAKSERGKRTIEVKGAMIAHHWDGNKSQWIADTPAPIQAPSQVLLSGHDTTNTPAESLQSTGSTNSGTLATNSLDAAANAARVAAAQRSFSTAVDAFVGQIAK